MDKNRLMLYCLASLLLLAWLFPPWKREVTEQLLSNWGSHSSSFSLDKPYNSSHSAGPSYDHQVVEKGHGWRFRFDPPSDSLAKLGNPEVEEVESTWTVDQTSLLIEILGIAVAGEFIVVASWGNKRRKNPEKDIE